MDESYSVDTLGNPRTQYRYATAGECCRVTVRDGSSLPVQTETLILWFWFTPRSTSVFTRVSFFMKKL